MHKEQIIFCKYVKSKFPDKFKNVRVLDCGSLDINGNNRYLFNAADYIGVDIYSGKNVDIVGYIHKIRFSFSFDIVISTEMLEHDRYWQQSINKMIELLKSDGLLIITCASKQRQEHGTAEHFPQDSPATHDYYRGLDIEELKEAINLNSFNIYELCLNKEHGDIYFWGLKK